MMLALGIYDKLTPGSLTGGAHIAGTGEITAAGDVGAIGGIRQKMYGARDAGAAWFLAPASNCDEVVGHVPAGLRVVGAHHGLPDPPKSQCAKAFPLLPTGADGAAHLGDLHLLRF